MNKHFNILLSAVVFAVSIFSFIYFMNSKTVGNQSLTEKANLLKNKSFPNILLPESATNKDFTAKLQSENVLIVYMLSNCQACQKETQLLSQVEAKTNVKIFGVMFEDENVVKDYIATHKVNFPVLIDKEKKLLEQLNLQYFPTNLTLKGGVITNVALGLPENETKLLELMEE